MRRHVLRRPFLIDGCSETTFSMKTIVRTFVMMKGEQTWTSPFVQFTCQLGKERTG